jgi:hypothetical protein
VPNLCRSVLVLALPAIRAPAVTYNRAVLPQRDLPMRTFDGIGLGSAGLVLTLSVTSVASQVSCARCSPHGRDAGVATSFRVPALPSSVRVTPDGQLDEWRAVAPVASISAADAVLMQWSCIRGERPKRPTESDFAATVYMAWDAIRWYIAVDVSDDVVRGAHPVPITAPTRTSCLSCGARLGRSLSRSPAGTRLLGGPQRPSFRSRRSQAPFVTLWPRVVGSG